MKFNLTLILVAPFIVFSSIAQSALLDRGDGMIYDDQLNITWLQDANYVVTSGYAVANETDIGRSSPTDSRIVQTDGRMSWTSANTWANNLIFAGYDDWRLPTITGDLTGRFDFESPLLYLQPNSGDFGFYIETPNNEMSFNYYQNLGNTAPFTTHAFSETIGGTVTTDNNCLDFNCLFNTDPFFNIQPNQYWTDVTIFGGSGALQYDFGSGLQLSGDTIRNPRFAWAVRPGDVIITPIPPTFLLFGSGLLGLLSLRRKH